MQVQEDLTAHHGPELARGGRETVAGGSLTRGEDDRWDDVCSGIRTEILKTETIIVLHMDVCYIYVYFNDLMYVFMYV